MALRNVIGFSPNWYFGQLNEGLGIYISPGSIDGRVTQGGFFPVPNNFIFNEILTQFGFQEFLFTSNNETTFFWVTEQGVIQSGATYPFFGVFRIARVVAGEVQTSPGETFFPSTSPGILSIDDLRDVIGDFYFNMLSNNEVVAASGSTALLANIPDGVFLILTRNGVAQNIGPDFTLFGRQITFGVPVVSGEVILAWYTF